MGRRHCRRRGRRPDQAAVNGLICRQISSPLLLSLLVDAVASFGGALLLGAAVYLAKRGRPPGALLHALHALELTRLPGLLSPRRQRYSPW